MIEFECPKCLTKLTAEDQYGGLSMQCGHCMQMCSVPKSEKSFLGRSLLYVAIGTGFVVIISTILWVLLPLIAKLREAKDRAESGNNLRQIGMAFQGFHDAYKYLPYNGTIKAAKKDARSGSWGFQILPYLKQEEVFTTVDRTAKISEFLCPGRRRPQLEKSNGGGQWTDYFYNNYLNDPDTAAKPSAAFNKRQLNTISMKDGSSNTVVAGHGNISTREYSSHEDVAFSINIFQGGTHGTMRSGSNGSVSPTGWTLRRDDSDLPKLGSWGGPFVAGALMAMGDGSVKIFPYSTPKFGDFLTPNGGERVVLP